MSKRLDLPIEQILEEYQNGMSTTRLSEKYECSPHTIVDRLKECNIKIRSSAESNRLKLNLHVDQIIIDYKNGISVYEIAKKYDCGNTIIYNKLYQSGIDTTMCTLDLPIKQIINEYQDGISANKIAKKYNCSNVIILKKLRESGVEIRTHEEVSQSFELNLPIEQIIIDYQNEMSSYKIAKKYNCSAKTIINILKRSNIYIRTYKEAHNVSSSRICIKCGEKFNGKTSAIYCSDCNPPEYCYKWDEECREHNREKYDRECFFCSKSEEELGKKLDSHHVDNNKNQGCDDTPDWKLVPLCNSCHGFTKGGIENRLIWEARIMYLYREYWS